MIMAKMAYGWTPEEIQINYRYRSMAQIHFALTDYWDHKPEIDAAIAEDLQYAEQMRSMAGNSPFVPRLKAQELLNK